jgi:hypothetical protein
MGVGFNKLDRKAVNAPDIGEKNIALGPLPPADEERDSAEGTMGGGVNDRRLDHLDIQLKKFSRSRSHHPPGR